MVIGDSKLKFLFYPVRKMPAVLASLNFRIIPAGFNAPLEFLTGFTITITDHHH